MPSLVDLERKAWIKATVFNLCRGLMVRAEEQEAQAGVWRLPEARRRDCREIAWRMVKDAMRGPPNLEDDWVEEPNEEVSMSGLGLLHMTLAACGYPWPDSDFWPGVSKEDDTDVEAEDFIRLFLLYLDEWEAGRPMTLPRK